MLFDSCIAKLLRINHRKKSYPDLLLSDMIFTVAGPIDIILPGRCMEVRDA